MYGRDVKETLCSLLRGFPVVTVTGPRQSGKTTLARSVLEDKPYLSLEDPDVRQFALDDPRAFLERLTDGAVLDEVQRASELLSYLQSRVDPSAFHISPFFFLRDQFSHNLSDHAVLALELLLQGRDLAFDSGALAFARTLEKAGTALKELLLSTVEEVGLKTVLVAQVRDGNPLQQVLSKD